MYAHLRQHLGGVGSGQLADAFSGARPWRSTPGESGRGLGFMPDSNVLLPLDHGELERQSRPARRGIFLDMD